ncbi:hypothetical protein ASD65_09775 [Microbacterium sp. Root61]|uniref:enoyl-CoA hydratase-related protein n=1 Tax=Microbacterium sp. Root61 TaxID=1736570 RepID=UPI0006FA6141|nr:enoyl-CoA hydratase-related protein [Microbacterium sp. Root61]KRA24668.1 hypothetical protein ASD65_09775 [Microbacterium sp. Root61]
MTTEIDYRLTRDDAVLTLTLSAPATRNALTKATRVALVDDLQIADDDPGIRVVIITGDDPAFTSGVNAKELLGEANYVTAPLDPATRLRGMRTPTIAAINGSCISGGIEIMIACSFALASERAMFADTHAKLGISPGWGLSADLPALVGVGRARQLSLTGLPIDAATALSWGLVNEVLPHELLLPRARELAAAIASISPAAAENMVMLYASGQQSQLGDARRLERETADNWTVDRGASPITFGA